MLKEIKVVDEAKGIVRITTLNERWYTRQSENPDTKLPEYKFFPSSTWIAGYYPKGIGFYKWLADKGWDESEALKNAAGDKGTKIHHACEDIDLGKEIAIDAKYLNPKTGKEEELTIEEYDAVISYRDFIEDYKPIILANEISSFGEFYAGTIDKVFAIHNELMPTLRQIWIMDIKSGQNIFEEQKLQVSSYKYLNINYKALGITEEEWANRKLATIQVGYRLNKKRYKFTEVEDKYDLFKEVAYKIWQNENPDSKPKERDYPMVISSPFRKEQIAKQEAEKEATPEEINAALSVETAKEQPLAESMPEPVEEPEPKHKKSKK